MQSVVILNDTYGMSLPVKQEFDSKKNINTSYDLKRYSLLICSLRYSLRINGVYTSRIERRVISSAYLFIGQRHTAVFPRHTREEMVRKEMASGHNTPTTMLYYAYSVVV